MPLEVDPLRIVSDAAYMSEYHKSQTRDVMDYYLEKLAADFETRCLSYRPEQRIEDLIYHQGVLAGLKIAQGIPENVLRWAKEVSGERKLPRGIDSLTLG